GFFVERDGYLSLAATCCRGREGSPEPVRIEDAGHLGEAYVTGSMQLFGKGDVPGGMPAPEGFEHGISMPIEGIGVLHCFSMKRGAFTTDDVRMLDLLLDHAKQAVGRIRLESQLHEEAIRDRLTGLYNRNYFDEAVEREIERSRRSGEPIGFLMLDIDRFKEINDTYGHATGDDVLRGVARFLVGQVRTSEIVVRYGGDEFLIMMPGLTRDPEPVCERIREAFERWRAASGIPEEVDFDLSMGFSRWEPYDLSSVTEVISEADEAMYEEKRSHAAAGTGGLGGRLPRGAVES
ncbi:MAG: diguanylate cyclase, partial [Candidatus Eisenbacteria bacterium]|nr:diguanylate cyclase [Candidatus Eisenbacteria bacterium]